MSLLTDGNLLPSRQYAEASVLNKFALSTTGLNGLIVTLLTGNQNPANNAGAYTTQAPMAAFTNVANYRYGSLRQVRPSQAGDTRYNAVGITLHTVALYDENGNPLAGQPYDQTIERGLVQSGFVVPILTQGFVTMKSQNIIGTPFPGYLAVISTGGGGKVESINPVGATLGGLMTGASTYSGCQVIGKFLSYTGANFGGYSDLWVNFSA